MRSWRWSWGSEVGIVTTIRRRLRITSATRRTVIVQDDVLHAPCVRCGRDVAAVAWEEAGRLLQVPIEELQGLIAGDRVHVIVAITGVNWICRDSLFAARSP